MQAEDRNGRVPAEGRPPAQAFVQWLAALIRTEGRKVTAGRTWVDMRGLADYLSWSYDKVKKLSARNLIPGKVRHEGKVTFHLPTVDAWLQTEHAQHVLRLLPHEQRALRLSDDAVATDGVAWPGPRQADPAMNGEG